MNILIAFVFSLLSIGIAHAEYQIIYDTVTLDVHGYGYGVPTPNSPNLAIGSMKEDDPILKSNDYRDICYNPSTRKAQLKSQSEITARANGELKEKLQKQMFYKKQDLDYQLWKLSKGYEITKSTTTLQVEINNLESQINSIE